jgi:hypothetical protein
LLGKVSWAGGLNLIHCYYGPLNRVTLARDEECMSKNKIDLVDPIKLAEYIALTLCARGASISHLKLQKLMYYAQGWGLVFLKAPLFDEEPEAWVNGPVYRSVYNKFKGFQLYDDLRESDKFIFGTL